MRGRQRGSEISTSVEKTSARRRDRAWTEGEESDRSEGRRRTTIHLQRPQRGSPYLVVARDNPASKMGDLIRTL